jgi:hypothetical protein
MLTVAGEIVFGRNDSSCKLESVGSGDGVKCQRRRSTSDEVSNYFGKVVQKSEVNIGHKLELNNRGTCSIINYLVVIAASCT